MLGTKNKQLKYYLFHLSLIRKGSSSVCVILGRGVLLLNFNFKS